MGVFRPDAQRLVFAGECGIAPGNSPTKLRGKRHWHKIQNPVIRKEQALLNVGAASAGCLFIRNLNFLYIRINNYSGCHKYVPFSPGCYYLKMYSRNGIFLIIFMTTAIISFLFLKDLNCLETTQVRLLASSAVIASVQSPLNQIRTNE